jgi:hypothetical protein
MNWQATTTDKVISKKIGEHILWGWVKIYADNNSRQRVSAVVFFNGDSPVESRQKTFYDVDEATAWAECVFNELAREASWQTL